MYRHSLDCATAGTEQQRLTAYTVTAISIKLDQDVRIVTSRQCICACPRLGIAVNYHCLGDGRQSRRWSNVVYALAWNVEMNLIRTVRGIGQGVRIQNRLTQGPFTTVVCIRYNENIGECRFKRADITGFTLWARDAALVCLSTALDVTRVNGWAACQQRHRFSGTTVVG